MKKRLIARVGLVKVYRCAYWDEFQVVGPDSLTTFEADKESAMGTAKALARLYGLG